MPHMMSALCNQARHEMMCCHRVKSISCLCSPGARLAWRCRCASSAAACLQTLLRLEPRRLTGCVCARLRMTGPVTTIMGRTQKNPPIMESTNMFLADVLQNPQCRPDGESLQCPPRAGGEKRNKTEAEASSSLFSPRRLSIRGRV